MAKRQTSESTEIQVQRPDSILKELTDLEESISKRAYELFLNPTGLLGGALADWLHAERELVWSPDIELRQKGGEIELKVALAGVDPKILDVRVTPNDILITAEKAHRHEEDDDTVHVCEFSTGRLFRSVHLPRPIDPETASAEFRNGMLRLTASVAKTAGRKVDVHAA